MSTVAFSDHLPLEFDVDFDLLAVECALDGRNFVTAASHTNQTNDYFTRCINEAS